jgi:anti-sigma regulatory factor (Ser/Thr protein kinase)
MATSRVRLAFTPAPVHVRTARLVGVAVARRAGVAEELLDEVRLAIGEACTRAVALHRQYGLADLVQVEMSDGDTYTVRVTDRAPVEAGLGLTALPPDELANESLTDEALTVGVGFALLAGLVDDLQVRPAEEGVGTEVCMHWPLRSAPGGTRRWVGE